VTLSGYRYDNALPHVYRSTDGGSAWEDISGNLPDAPVNDIIVDPALDSTLYLATDFGVFVTRTLGEYWQMLGDDLPNVPVVDLDFHQPTRTLVAATYGRSMYSFDVDQLVDLTDPGNQERSLVVYPNPAIQEINVKLDLRIDTKYFISDLGGKIIASGTLKNSQSAHCIDLSGISTGNYLLTIKAEPQNLTSKFTKL